MLNFNLGYELGKRRRFERRGETCKRTLRSVKVCLLLLVLFNVVVFQNILRIRIINKYVASVQYKLITTNRSM